MKKPADEWPKGRDRKELLEEFFEGMEKLTIKDIEDDLRNLSTPTRSILVNKHH